MEKYTINYQTGITEEIEVYDLNEAKKVAKEGISYTQQNVSIEDAEGNTITTATWHGYKPTEDEEGLVLETIGGGFYQIWEDELENL